MVGLTTTTWQTQTLTCSAKLATYDFYITVMHCTKPRGRSKSGQGHVTFRNIYEYFEQFGPMSTVHERYRQMTDSHAPYYSQTLTLYVTRYKVWKFAAENY